MERACLFVLVILTGLSSALAECPPASCRCRDRELATCINTDDANCSVLCLQGNYTAKEPLAVSYTRDLSVIADAYGSATVTCNGGGTFLAVSDTDYVELRNVVVKNCFQAVNLKTSLEFASSKQLSGMQLGPLQSVLLIVQMSV